MQKADEESRMPAGPEVTPRPDPRVTVLMTVFNDERFVGQAIQSILCQTYEDFELIIVNDGSTDATSEIVAGYAASDDRVRVLTQSNSGTTAAANLGLGHARGIYVARLDSDDLSYRHRLRTEVDFLDAHPEVGLVGGGSDIIDEAGQVIGVRNIRTSNPARVLMHRCIYQQSDVMFRREVVLAIGGYRAKFRNAQDYDLWLRISEVRAVAKLDTVLGQWRLNPGGYTLSRSREQKIEFETIRNFARQRRGTGRDAYDSYVPPPPPPHRQAISREEYDLLVSATLIQALRPERARPLIRSVLSSRPTLRGLALYALALLPTIVTRAILAARDWYLNRIR